MTKQKLVAQVARWGQKKAVLAIVDDLFDAIAECTLAGDTIRLPGFGTFYRKVHKSRRVVHAGEEFRVPGISSIGFRASKARKIREAGR